MTAQHALSRWQDPASVVAFTPDGTISAAQFHADVCRLAEQLSASFPTQRHILNVCSDRYRFIVGLAASLVADKISLLPASQTAETARQLRAIAPDLFCLHDEGETAFELPPDILRLAYPATVAVDGALDDFCFPEIPAERVAAYVFTSGSTGLPVPHRKTWGALVRNAAAAVTQLDIGDRPHAIVATVPPQHMYGFESTVLLNLLGHCPVWSGRPFYPADIAQALAAMPHPRMLVTTPFHLRALLDSGIALPAVDRILSATAPLPLELAQRAEQQLGAPVVEIYGCTETGQIASRQVTASPAWQLMAGIALSEEDSAFIASGGHIEGRIPLGDVLELQADGRFLLLGRQSDLINIAGKRTSLAYLNQQLLAIDGVEDGSFFMPNDDDANRTASIARLCAIVVAPQLSPKQLQDALRQRVDSVFMPRPLLFVEQLPRNATGKLPRNSLAALVRQHLDGLASRRELQPDPTR